MSERGFHAGLLVAFVLAAASVAPLLVFVRAPYGRYARPGWGRMLPDRLGWALMELPAVAVFAACFAVGQRFSTAAIAFFALWQLHYLYRVLPFALVLRTRGRRLPVLVLVFGIVFNVVNAYLNGRWLFTLGPARPTAWLHDPRFVVGVVLFVLGFSAHVAADSRLRRLRPNGYVIPQGGLFRWVSCPNYLGEIVEWSGWALATWSLPGLAFALWTAANLAPRALAHQRWYRERFVDYPPERRVLVPGIW